MSKTEQFHVRRRSKDFRERTCGQPILLSYADTRHRCECVERTMQLIFWKISDGFRQSTFSDRFISSEIESGKGLRCFQLGCTKVPAQGRYAITSNAESVINVNDSPNADCIE